jgi:hypothetical protein
MPDHRRDDGGFAPLYSGEQVVSPAGQGPLRVPGFLGRGHHAQQQQGVLAVLRPLENLDRGWPPTTSGQRAEKIRRHLVIGGVHLFPRIASRSAMSASTVSRI